MTFIAQNRWQAFAIHLLISLVLFLLLAAVIRFCWYPGFLFLYDGGVQGMKLIAGVDFLIGPFLTLAVYKLGKKSLRFDLACIAVLQVVCLVAGMWAVWSTRPVAVVYAAGSFTVVNMHAYNTQNIDIDQVKLLQEASWPVWLAVDLDTDGAGAAAASALWSFFGSGLAYNVDNYVTYDTFLKNIAADGLTANQAAEFAEISKAKNFPADVRFYPVSTSMQEGYLAIHTETGEVVDSFFEDVTLF